MSMIFVGYIYAIGQMVLWFMIGWTGGVLRHVVPMPIRNITSTSEMKHLDYLAIALWAFSSASFLMLTETHRDIGTVTLSVIMFGFAYLTYPFHGGVVADILNITSSRIWHDRTGVKHYGLIMRMPEMIYFIIIGFIAAERTPWYEAMILTIIAMVGISSITMVLNKVFEDDEVYDTDGRLDQKYQKAYIYHYITRCMFIQAHTIVMLLPYIK